VDHEMYIDKADKSYSAGSTVFNRGTIFFQNKDGSLVSAATLQTGYIVAINPQMITDPETVYTKLNEIIPVDHDLFIQKASKKTDPYEELARKVDVALGQKIKDLKIPGLSVYKEKWRFYPGGSSASQTIGLLGYKGDEYAGRYGLERQYESVLERKSEAYTNFFAQIFSGIKKETTGDTISGDVVTTIEPTIQYFLEKELASTTEKWSSESTAGIIMNPKTGEIYAMGVYPTFNPNKPEGEKNVSIFSNPLVENRYEMGSIIKPLTIASGIDAGVITASSTYYDKGYVIVNKKRIGNFDNKVRGTVTMQDALSQSLNTGMAHVVGLLGNDLLTQYMLNFGVGEKTGIDLPNEGRNLIDPLKSNLDIDHVTASFGQGISLTPINAIRVLATLANGGVTVQPHVVKQINYKIGLSKEIPIVQGKRVIKRETAEEVTRMMVYSVDNVLANGKYKMNGYSIAVKTGTAQIAKPNGGGYSDTDFLHSFVGYFPAYNPQFFVLLYTLKPQGIQFGSETLSAPFMDIAKFLINYYEIPPDR
jgi:cell division protein FtsI/penicillin-binding protein 2